MTAAPESTERRKRLLLITAIALAAFMAALDATIVNIALPTISEAFDVSTGMVSWVATAYLLVVTGCLLIFGKLADMRGLKKIFLAGFLIFSTGSFFCGSLPVIFDSFWALVGSRVFQGIGGAMIGAIAPAMVTSYFPSAQRAQNMGLVVTFASLGTAIGPFLGGILTQYLSWHWIFFINVPVGVGAIILGRKVLPADSRSTEHLTFDYLGGVLVFVAMVTGIFALNMGPQLGAGSPLIIGSVVICLASAVYFYIHERSVTDPVLDLSYFRNRNFLLGNLALTLLMLAFAGTNFLLPFFLEYVKGFDTSTAGIVMTSLSFAMMIGGPIAGALYNRFGARILSSVGALVGIAGFLLLTGLNPDTTVLIIGIGLALMGFAVGFFMAPNNNRLMTMVPRARHGMVSSLLNTERYAGQSLGIVIFELVFFQTLAVYATRHGIGEGSLATLDIPDKLVLLSKGFDGALWAGVVILVVVLVLSILGGNTGTIGGKEDDEGEEGDEILIAGGL
jgi:EmrB/QacA subfamily drug resistance transporter